jgi:hypothetical protein
MQKNENVNENRPARSIADELRAKRTAIVREANSRVKRIDRSLALLESTDAEQVLAEAREVNETV